MSRTERLIAMALVFVTVMSMVGAVLHDDLTTVRENGRTNRDRIAACVTSTDVVGCLKEAADVG